MFRLLTKARAAVVFGSATFNSVTRVPIGLPHSYRSFIEVVLQWYRGSMCSSGHMPKDRSENLSQCTAQGVRRICTQSDYRVRHGLRAARQPWPEGTAPRPVERLV